MSTQDPRKQLNGPRKRARKQAVAARDGARCTYCRIPFTDLRQATLDHVAPLSLLRTWAAANLVLACHSCNQAKADRLPLLLALTLLATVGHPTRVADPAEADTGMVQLLARLAHIRQTADRATWRGMWEVAA
ncbi:HNH endonuclease [Streptomyces sp. SBT349]|uniref:HNH endonuclease n=1 Tax=Streptomyces sp. SBT349 TaxID=1580539 RepID=UPI0007C87673|nr:HNH endonuclease signature motif containing protein [Streptomyces sp. SBT349]